MTGYAKYAGNRYNSGGQGGVSTVFNFFANDEEDSFSLVDNAPAPRQRYGARRFQNRNFQRRNWNNNIIEGGDMGKGAERERARQQRMQSKKQQQWNTWAHNRNRETITYSGSVDIRPDWDVAEQINLSQLTKLQASQTPPHEELVRCGSLAHFDKTYDRVTPKLDRDLQKSKKNSMNPSTSDDPVMADLMAKKSGTVYATDNMVSAVMCAARSVYGWDLIVTKRDGALVMDKRSEGNFDLLTVSETAQAMIEDDKDNINGVHKLSEESTRCNFDYSQQVLTEDYEKFGTDADPFGANDASAAKVGYRYRKWNVGDGITLVSRHGLNGVTDDKTGAKALLSIKTLNEFDSKIAGVDYRKQIETQRGAVIATELKNNANKLAKWTCEALLAGADQLKLGFVSRTHPKDPNNHAIVNTQTYKPKDFAQQINLTEGNMWGVFKSVVEMCMKMEDGKYLLVKDANKPILRTYIVGDGEFNDDYASEPINGH